MLVEAHSAWNRADAAQEAPSKAAFHSIEEQILQATQRVSLNTKARSSQPRALEATMGLEQETAWRDPWISE
jgi:hypothetical protein